MSEDNRKAGETPNLTEVLDVLRPHVEKIDDGFRAIRAALDGLAEQLGRGGEGSARRAVAADERPRVVVRDVPPVVAAPELPPVQMPEPELPPVVAQPPRVAPPIARPTAPAAPPRATSIPVSGGGAAGNWNQIIFGPDLASDPGVAFLSGRLLQEVYAGDNDAIGLVGQLMDFRSADTERKLRLLKDIGEAFYRWRPTGEERLRDVLIAWVHALLERSGIPNRLTIVQVGDRYDMQAHNAKERGVEVSDVKGWVVLRDNGKVYSKANVSVR